MTHAHSERRRMPLVESLAALAEARRNEIVVTTMGAAREWPKLSSHELDFHYLPSAMGHAPMLALGLALAQPRREVICFNGDGCMLMSLGCLVTLVASGARNLTLVLLENGIYEVTGGQRTAASTVAADFAGFARAAGFPSVREYDELTRWSAEVRDVLALPGPRFVVLHVAPVADYQLPTLPPMPERIEHFQSALSRE